jgi:chromate transporter
VEGTALNFPIYFLLLLKGSLFSMSGLGNVPSVHADLLARGWASDRQFAEAIAVGQVSPGPNGLWVISLGYLTGGPWGAALALLAITLPPLLVLAIERAYQRVSHHPAVEGFVQGLASAAIGIFALVLFSLLRQSGLSVRTFVLVAASAALGATGRLPALAIIVLAACAGLIFR